MDSILHTHLDWLGLLQQWVHSNQSPAELARELGLAEATSAGPEAQAGSLFRRAEVVDARPQPSGASCRVYLPSGATLELDDAIDPHWAAALIQALEQPA